MKTRYAFTLFATLAATLAAGLLSGCAGSFAPTPVTPNQVPIGNIQGSVHGGNLPVTGADIYLYQASTSEYGTQATSLICNSAVDTDSCPSGTYGPFKDSNGNYYVQTDPNGSFSLGGDYMCTENDQVYMVAVGGNPGVGTTTTTATFSDGSDTITVASASGVSVGELVTGTGINATVTGVSGKTVTLSRETASSGSGVSVTFAPSNPAIVQMTGLGQCPSAGNLAAQVPHLVINEVTTVAFAYAMGGFATTPYNVSADAGGQTGLANAMANFLNIVDVGSGLAYTTTPGNPNGATPLQKINALADILSTCVNQTSATTSPCTDLFEYATTSAGTHATDEGSAIFNIVHNQAVEVFQTVRGETTTTQNAGNLYSLVTGNTPFYPYLSSAPSDWTMPVIYNNAVSALASNGSTYTSGAFGMAFDAYGNAWIGDRAKGVVEVGPQGAITLFANNDHDFGMVKGVAVSPQDGSIWVTDFGNNDIYVMDPTGTKLTTITTDVAGHGPDATAFALNPAAAGTYLAYEAEESSTGIVPYSAVTYDAEKATTEYPELTSPGWITVDNTGAAWISSLGSTDIGGLTTTYKNDQLTFTSSTKDGFAESYVGIADGLGNIWLPSDATPYKLYKVTAGADMGDYTGGGMDLPWRAAVDGNNVVWLANLDANTISGFSTSSLSFLSSTGFSTSAPSNNGVASIGVDASGNVWTANADGSVTQLLGLGTPAAAPLYGGSTVTTTGRGGTTTYTSGNLGKEP